MGDQIQASNFSMRLWARRLGYSSCPEAYDYYIRNRIIITVLWSAIFLFLFVNLLVSCSNLWSETEENLARKITVFEGSTTPSNKISELSKRNDFFESDDCVRTDKPRS